MVCLPVARKVEYDLKRLHISSGA